MKLLLVGGGAREHALASKFVVDDPGIELVIAPGNAGLASLGRCVPVAITDIPGLLALAAAERPELTVVGPEAPLAAGIVDRFRQAGFTIFGPTRAAAEIESSKSFAKQLMLAAGIPTARASSHTDPSSARRAARDLGAPVVIKACGLAAGKGVFVCGDLEEADRAIDAVLQQGSLGSAGAEILVEEYMEGEELSLFALTDGEGVLPMIPAQDHKRLLEGDQGPNTGGMGAYAPVSLGAGGLVRTIVGRIIEPTLAGLREAGRPFSGLLYAGLMITADGPRVVEFNCRFGDPETEAILPLLASDLRSVLHGIALGERVSTSPLSWKPAYAVTTVVAAAGYPDAARKGDPITLPEPAPGVHIFHAGTARSADGELVTAGGRVFAVTGVAGRFDDARAASLRGASAIDFAGRQLRADIGWREATRRARASRD